MWLKLSQKMMEEFEASERTRLPLFRRTATVLLLVVVLAWLDQAAAVMELLLARFEMTRLPSPEMASCHEAPPSARGFSRLATHAGVNFETVLNHTPRYHFGAVLLLPLPPAIWKNPSANLPLPETSLLPPASGRPAVTVSVAAGGKVVISREKRNGTKRSAMARWLVVCKL
ncbi:Os04g0506500, partial [Oryza sativa Japonica Group]